MSRAGMLLVCPDCLEHWTGDRNATGEPVCDHGGPIYVCIIAHDNEVAEQKRHRRATAIIDHTGPLSTGHTRKHRRP